MTNIYEDFDKNLYRLSTSIYADEVALPEIYSDGNGTGSIGAITDPLNTPSGPNVQQIVQYVGANSIGKQDFTNLETGYILGIDAKEGKAKFYIGNTTNYLNWTGTELVISGNITATTGTIGGFVIGATTISSTNFVLDSFDQRISLGSGNDIIILDANDSAYRMWVGNADPALAPFTVTKEGVLNATGAVISGTITADSGTIGGFTITPTTLYGGIIQTAATVGSGSTGVVMDTGGLRGYDAILGLTFNLPTNGDTPTFSSGIINNTIYEINTNAILRTSTTVGDGSASSAGILINDTGFYATEANQLLADANVKILVDGTATIKMSVKGGQTDFNTGIGYFLGLSGGDYKFSIGNPAGNYLTWDGTYLKMKGSFDVGSGGLINNAVYTVTALPIAPTSIGFNNPSAYE